MDGCVRPGLCEDCNLRAQLKVHCERAVVAQPKTLNVIGVALAKQPRSHEHADVPLLVTTCIRDIASRGVDQEGLYRIAGGRPRARCLAHSAVPASSPTEISSMHLARIAPALCGRQGSSRRWRSSTRSLRRTVDTSYEPDINVLTGCLKMFFRQVRPPGAGFKRVAPPASAYARARELSASDPSLWRHHLAP